MQGRNAHPAVAYLAGDGWERDVLLLDRAYQKMDNSAEGRKAWDTMRDLHKIWRFMHDRVGAGAGGGGSGGGGGGKRKGGGGQAW
eukprot:g8115.t1